jgi:hypothetical protein
MTPAATASGKLHGARRQAGGFLVEDIERRQTDVGDFLFAKDDLLIGRDVRRRRDVGYRSAGRR